MQFKAKILMALLMLSAMGAPALADHHQEKKHTPDAATIMAHAPMRQARMNELLKTGEMSVSLMKLAHKQMDSAIAKKDHSAVEKALETFQAARHLHHENKQTLDKMSEHLNQHLQDIKAGKIALNTEQANIFEKEVTLFTQQVKAYEADCHTHVRPKNQAMRKQALAFLMEDFAAAQKAEQADKMVHIAKIMKLLPPFKGH